MAIYRPTYTDRKTGKLLKSRVWWYAFQFNGERIRESSKTTNKRTAEQIQAAHRTSLAKGRVGIVSREPAPALKDFAPQFEEQIKVECASKPQTIEFYRSKLSFLLKHEPLASARLDAIDEEAIDGYIRHRTRQVSRRGTLLSPASVNRELAVLRRLLRVARKWKLIESAPGIKMLDGEQEREFVLSPAQEKLYLGAAPPDLCDFGILSLDTGLRVSEALTLDWEQVHLEPVGDASLGYLRVLGSHSKNSKPRNIPLTARVAEMLLRRRGQAASGLVFHREDGSPLYQTWLNQQHAALRTLLKLPVEFVPHSFRHSFGTRLGEAGADAFTIMRLMGHSSVTVSQKYVHPTPEAMERALQQLDALNGGDRNRNDYVVVQETAKVEKRHAGKKQLTR